jgi:hypothetical protein
MKNILFETLKRPVSHQAKNRENLQKWKDFIYGRALMDWNGVPPFKDFGLRFTLVYLCDNLNSSPFSVKNINESQRFQSGVLLSSLIRYLFVSNQIFNKTILFLWLLD